GELEHRHVKRFYARTNRVAYELQIARKERNRSLLASIRAKDSFRPLSALKEDRKRAKIASAEANARSVHSHSGTHNILSTINYSSHVHLQNFITLLRDHLVMRFIGPDAEPEDGFTEKHTNGIQICNDRLYRHKTIRINHTTYDMRREQDNINPRTHADIMLLSSDSDVHPFWYARVLDIYHANVRYTGPGSTHAMQEWQRIDFVWVRWFEHDLSYQAGFQHRRLPRLQFMDADDPDNIPFSFVNPDDIIQAAYLIPAFEHGGTTHLLGTSKLARRLKDDGDDCDDWCYFYVCM
ncbi:hypothetical protein BD311DRAFT_832274, partial [Dichomitus squalens]